MMRWPAAAQVQSPIWSLSIIPQLAGIFAATSKLAGGVGSAEVKYVASSNARGSCRALCLPSLSFLGSICEGLVRSITVLCAPGNSGSIFFRAIEQFSLSASEVSVSKAEIRANPEFGKSTRTLSPWSASEFGDCQTGSDRLRKLSSQADQMGGGDWQKS